MATLDLPIRSVLLWFFPEKAHVFCFSRGSARELASCVTFRTFGQLHECNGSTFQHGINGCGRKKKSKIYVQSQPSSKYPEKRKKSPPGTTNRLQRWSSCGSYPCFPTDFKFFRPREAFPVKMSSFKNGKLIVNVL